MDKKQLSSQNQLALTLATTVAAVSWFAPLANQRIYENAFALDYTGVN
jgi:hypothetical protein